MSQNKRQVKKRPLEVAFDMGQKAFHRGIFDSPYKESSFLHKEWKRGFNTGYFINQKIALGAVPEKAAK